MEELSVLFVDDDPMVLKALERLFRRSRYRYFMAESGERALEIMERHPIHLLISDHRMPGMSGVELCRSVAGLYPTTMRFILSAYPELHDILAALEKGEVQRLLNKPLDMHRLIDVVDRALEQTQVIQHFGDLVHDLNREKDSYRYDIDFMNGTINVNISADSSQMHHSLATGLLQCLFDRSTEHPEFNLIGSVLSRQNGKVQINAEFGVGLRLAVSLPIEEKE